MKKLMWIVLVLIVLVVIGVTIFLMKLDGIIQHTVETQGTKQLNVTTKLGDADLSILGGNLALKDFSLASPQGYSAPQMLSLGKAAVTVSYRELRGEVVKVANIELVSPKLVIEQKGTNFNFKTLIDGMPKGEPGPQPTPETGGEPVKMIINNLDITGAEVVIMPDPKLAEQFKMKDYTLKIPNINMKGIGTGEGNQNGAAIKDVVTQVITTMASKASESDQLPAELRALLKGDLSAVADQVKGEAQKRINEELQKASEKAGVDLGKAAEDLKKGNTQDLQKTGEDLLGRFGQKKDDKKPTTQPAK
jgi:hypothetical protein